MMREIRSRLWVKALAILLFAASACTVALGFCGMVILDEGGAVANTYFADKLCTDHMESAMYMACWHLTEDDSNYYYGNQLITHYQGITVRVYEGAEADGSLVGTWGEMPQTVGVKHTVRAEPYTLVGYLSAGVARGSVFYVTQQIYYLLHPLAGGGILTLTGVFLLLAVLLLVFLLCSAGHRAGCEGVVPNWQDRVPLDLYLCVVGTGVFCALGLGVSIVDSIDAYFYLSLSIFALCLLVSGLMVLAALMTIATRLKLGKWWRNTLCFMLLRWCWQLWRGLCGFMADVVHLLPMTWRWLLVAAGVLFGQSTLILAPFNSYSNAGFLFLLLLIFDIALLMAVMWLGRQLQLLQDAAAALAKGDLETKADTTKMYFDCRQHAEHLNTIGVGMTRAVEQRLKSERLKTELITNVSHDIKTPLTSIVNYVDLLQKEELPERAGEYVTVLDRQARRLKKLTEDLVEASKASTGNMTVKLEPIVVNEIIHQAIGDYNEKLAAGKLDVIVSTYEGSVKALADGRLLWRVLDNLLNNVCKYALSGTRVYVDLVNREGTILLSIKNISRDPLYVRPDELTERFVRGDTSRHTEGSGLGLNIAQSLMELMGGTFRVDVDGDLFKAELTLSTVDEQ